MTTRQQPAVFNLPRLRIQKGHEVNVFFIDDGVLWADSNRDFDIKTGTGDCPNEYLPYLVDNEVPIGV